VDRGPTAAATTAATTATTAAAAITTPTATASKTKTKKRNRRVSTESNANHHHHKNQFKVNYLLWIVLRGQRIEFALPMCLSQHCLNIKRSYLRDGQKQPMSIGFSQKLQDHRRWGRCGILRNRLRNAIEVDRFGTSPSFLFPSLSLSASTTLSINSSSLSSFPLSIRLRAADNVYIRCLVSVGTPTALGTYYRRN